ncbi:helix-turn-helix transcriptional regulator [Thermopolyspora sp. NPDC052614]|uniref:helix-turn-helix domain-containing protein n=1 Tax=Thermopolyspora sp. NPDC052614 TaxID=3155682 RepID=UPI00343ED537
MSNPVRIDPDESPRARFAYELRALRREHGLTQRQFGERIGYAESSIGMIEQGHRPPTQLLADLVDEAFTLPGTFAKLYLKTTWAGAPEHFRSWLLEEQDATALRGYEPTLIPGLFETEAYARAVLQSEPGCTPAQVDERVAARIERKSIFTRDKPPTIISIIDEGVLHRPVGGPEVMREQLCHLLELARHPHVTIQVLPYAANALCGLQGGFIIAERDGRPQAAYIEGQPQGRTTDDRALIAQLIRCYDAIRAEAHPQSHSLKIIKELIDAES